MVIAIASLLAMAMYNINLYVYKIVKNRYVAAFCFHSGLLSILLFGPLVYSLTSLGIIVNNFDFSLVERIKGTFVTLSYRLPESLSFLQSYLDDFLHELNLTSISKTALGYLGSIGKNSAQFFKSTFLIVIFLLLCSFKW